MPSLESLPPELLCSILSHAEPFNPTIKQYTVNFKTCKHNLESIITHPLYNLAATSKHLKDTVEEYARILLKKHAKFHGPKKSNKFIYRKKWLKWLDATCQLCHKKSVRKAIFDNIMTCCATCDKKEWPKMTMTDASHKHNLSRLDLFTPNILHPDLPKLSVALYCCMGTNATMLLEREVLERKRYIHDLLGDHAKNTAFMQSRRNRHLRIIKHMDVTIHRGKWIRQSHTLSAEKKESKSMSSAEERRRFTEKMVEQERMYMQG
ncbi:hypothetical protein K469DRAFT_658453 [Zopfia rhizophila CBS 207.26]|uniref:Uncharacterized protein n=1 Tax=Zopfia rhizophila CBS 207.26 TaxID=1314779 RepID=A0A6A6EG64_9PEZI|nr:hypothetical protein K469DRAFT_658453 [Zopfia rhizophila CBS 207.26]